MYKLFALVAAAAAIVSVSSHAAAQDRRAFEPPAPRVAKQQTGSALTLPSTASPRAVLARYLREQGRDESTARSLVEAAGDVTTRSGFRHVRFEQRTGGLAVYGTYAKAAFNARGELVHLVENLVPLPAGVARARITAQQAISAAIANLHPTVRGNAAGFWHRTPSATRVAVPQADGSMSAGFVVETWTEQTNQLHYTLVGSGGAILEVESRTSSDSYRVFRINPAVTPQEVVQGGTNWLFAGTQGSTNIAGNNVNAYLDVVSDNRSDSSGAAVATGDFLAMANLDESPSTPANREVAVQNLFYLNNVMHDELYGHGFVEAAGNFQENNFGLGGFGSDSVNAEAQDGDSIDNANFATPNDGSNPRMQMYLWTGKGTHQVVVNGSTILRAQGADFGPKLSTTGVSGTAKLVADAGGASVTDACDPIPAGSLTGLVAIVDRGTCNFVTKVKNAQNAGAKGAIVVNNRGDSIMTMGGTDSTIAIPAVFIGQSDGNGLKALVSPGVTLRLATPAPLQHDGDVDSDIVFHEYCHGLTWRMIGRMSGPLAGAIGEGMSDTCSMLMNQDPVIGEYVFDDPLGIRRFSYENYPLTYNDVTGAEVHDDGEIYGAIGWQLLQNFGTPRKDDLFDYLVDGMNFTPEQPTYEQMRDGILQATSAADDCLVWKAFAKYGVGVGAKSRIRGKSVVITESRTLPSYCQP